MANLHDRLDQALVELIEVYSLLESDVEDKFPDDQESYANAIIEGLEAAIESSIDEGDISTNQFAAILSNLTEALEQLDPSAFEDDTENTFSIPDMGMDEEDDDDLYGDDDYE